MALMHSHLDQVATRALVTPTPARGRDLLDVLAPYADDGTEPSVAPPPMAVAALKPRIVR
jgi:hypothetical protein